MCGKGVDSRPCVNSALVSSAIFSKCFACLVGSKKCVFRVTAPKKLGRVGRDFLFFLFIYFFFFFFFNKCGLFCKRHLSRYDHILMF